MIGTMLSVVTIVNTMVTTLKIVLLRRHQFVANVGKPTEPEIVLFNSEMMLDASTAYVLGLITMTMKPPAESVQLSSTNKNY